MPQVRLVLLPVVLVGNDFRLIRACRADRRLVGMGHGLKRIPN